MNTSTIVWAAIVIIIVLGGGWYYFANSNGSGNAAPTGQTQTNNNPNGPDYSPNGAPAANTATITYTDQGFTPSTVTIKSGDTVTWVNQSAGQMWVASNPHPTHEGYDGTTKGQHCAAGYSGAAPLDECAAGASFSFTFTKTGSWGYHNHADHSMVGTVIVQ